MYSKEKEDPPLDNRCRWESHGVDDYFSGEAV